MKAEDFTHEITQTSAIFGRQQDVSVEFQGDEAYTDGKTIVLPTLPQGMEFAQEEVVSIRGYLDHEAGHIRHTDFTLIKPFGDVHGQEAFRIANCLEDIRLESLVMKEYPGAEKNLRGLMDSIKDKESGFMDEHPELFGDKPTLPNVCSAICNMGREGYNSSSYREAVTSRLPEKYKAWGNKWREEVLKCKNTKEVLNMAIKIKELLDTSRNNQKEEQEESKSEDGKGEGLDGDPADFTFDPNGDPTKGNKDNGSGKESEVEVQAVPSSDISGYCEDLIKKKVDGYLKEANPTGKVKYRVLSTKLDEVFSTTSKNNRRDERVDLMKKGTSVQYEQLKSNISGQVNTMKARIRRALMAKERRDWDFGREFGRIDTKRLVAGFQGAQGVFKQRKDRVEANTSVMMLVDLSGSMSGNKCEVARDAIVAFAECLEGTQIKYEINGFDNGYRREGHFGALIDKAEIGSTEYHRVEPLNIFQFKKFDDPLRVSKGAISAIGDMASGNNSDNDAVLWCLQRLSKERTERKVLIVLSDGQPANYTINVTDHRDPLVRALTDTVKSAKKDYGVECVGVGILTSHVKTIYPKSVSINKISDLSGSIFNQLSEILTGGVIKL